MIYKHKTQRVAVLVDVQNLYYSAKNLYDARINFRELLKTAIAGRQIVRANAYVIRTDIFKQEQDFFDALNKSGFDIKEKDLQVFAGGQKKGDWDVGIAMDMIRQAQKSDAIVLMSGDGDYIPVVNYVQQTFGCTVEVIAFGRSCSKNLVEEADEFLDIEKDYEKYLFKKRYPTKIDQTKIEPNKPAVL
ncbi:MAG: NYN domain-containing protein [bacterium]